MKKIFVKTYVFLRQIILFSVFGYVVIISIRDLSSSSVTNINVVSGILAVIIGFGLAMAVLWLMILVRVASL